MALKKFIIYYLNCKLLQMEICATYSTTADQAIQKFDEQYGAKYVFLRIEEIISDKRNNAD